MLDFWPSDLKLGPLLATFILVLASLYLLIVYSRKKQTYWNKIGVRCVEPIPILGSVWENMRKPLHELQMKRHKKYGRIYGHYEGNSALLSVAEPDLLRQIFVKDFHAFTGRRNFETGSKLTDRMLSVMQGEEWKRVRNIITPTFTTGKIKRVMGIFKECCQTLIQNFKGAANKGESVSVIDFYGAFSMDVIASAAFSTKIDSHNDPNNKFVQVAQTVFTKSVPWRFYLFALFPNFMKFFKMCIFPPKGIEFFRSATQQIIEERRRTGQRRNDFLQLLIDTTKDTKDEDETEENEKDDITENYGKQENDQVFKQTTYTKKTLSTEEMIAQCIIFFLAGYHPVTYMLSFASYALALNPAVQEKLIQELDDVLQESNGKLTYEAIQGMKYLDNVISETLRMYPLGVQIERLADEDYKLGDTGLTIPKGMVVTVPVFSIHRDPNLYPEPEKFDPDRFTPEERAKRSQYCYIPFGHGPRNCIGMRFALIEAKVCLALVLSNFRLKRCPKTKVPPDFYVGQQMLMPKDITLTFEVRKDSVAAL